jgi:hypothetical protein
MEGLAERSARFACRDGSCLQWQLEMDGHAPCLELPRHIA